MEWKLYHEKYGSEENQKQTVKKKMQEFRNGIEGEASEVQVRVSVHRT
jgi:hypothetical protein